MNVHFQCVVQVCRGSCPNPQCGGGGGGSGGGGGVIGGGGGGGGVPNQDSYGAPQSPVLDRYVNIYEMNWPSVNGAVRFRRPSISFPCSYTHSACVSGKQDLSSAFCATNRGKSLLAR